MRRHSRFVLLLSLAAVYFLSGKFGLSLAFVHASASPVWPPTGLALAALLLGGSRLWPAIFLGAFLVNYTTTPSIVPSLGIAAGNTLEALAGAWLVNRFAEGVNAFEQARTIFRFVLAAGLLSTTISATLGVTTLCLASLAAWQHFPAIWFTWWLGDVVSNLVIAPLILIWAGRPPPPHDRRQLLEIAAIFVALLLFSGLVFLTPFPLDNRNAPLDFLALIPLIWAAFRFGLHGAVTASFILSSFALWGTLHGAGPFVTSNANQSLLFLQAFIGTNSLTALVLASLLLERHKAEEALREDIAARKKAEQALREREERYELVLAGAEAAIWDWDVPGKRVVYSPRWKKLRGLSDTEVSDSEQEWSKGIHPQDVDRVMAAVKAHFEGQTTVFAEEYRVRHKDGHWIWILDRGLAMRGAPGRVIRMAGSETDITERKRAEEALAESEERYRSLVSVITDVPWTTDAEGRFVAPQPAWASYTGQSWEEYRDFGWIHALHPDDRSTLQELWQRACRNRTLYESSGRLWHAPSQQYRYFVTRATPLLHPDGTVREWVGTCTDVDDQKRAEELLQSQARHLESLVQERTAKLREIIGELEGYSYSISHDMRAPLRAMQSYAQVLLDDLGPRLDETNRRYLDRIMSAANRLDKLITDVLSYSRISRAEIDLRPINLDRLVEEITFQYPLLQAAQIEVQGTLGTVFAAEALLAQAIANLLINAVKFIAPGVEPRIKIWSEEQKTIPFPALKIFIQDNGIGMAPEDQQRIFGIFVRVHSEREYEGTGIGLSVVKKAVERIGGTVGVTSQLGKGSTFWIELRKAAN